MATLTITQNGNTIAIQQGGTITFSGDPGAIDAASVSVDNTGFDVLTGSNLQVVTGETDAALLDARTTGIRYGGTVTGLGTTTISVASGAGAVLDNTDPENPIYMPVNWLAQSVEVVPGLQWVCINSSGILERTTTEPGHATYRTCIQLGRISVNDGVITGISGTVAPTQQLAAQIWDAFRALGVVKRGLLVYSSGANLKIAIEEGEIYQAGSNFFNDPLEPHETPFPIFDSGASDVFRMVTQNGVVNGNITDLPVGDYDVGGTVTPIPGSNNRATIFRVYRFPGVGNVRAYYGQEFFSSLTAAVDAVNTNTYKPIISNSFKNNAILLGSICAVKNATDLSNASQAVFIGTDRFGRSE